MRSRRLTKHLPLNYVSALLLPVVLSLPVCLIAIDAAAHARWKLDGLLTPRIDADNIKDGNGRQYPGPCGTTQRASNPVSLMAGADIEVEWQATIYHEGYFRIRFSESGDNNWENTILLDNVRENRGQEYYSATITLPDIACDQCTLQLVQVMEDRNPPTNYYSCSDVVLTKPIVDTAPPNNVSNLSAAPSEEQIALSWTNPADDFEGALIVQAGAPVNMAPQDGTEYQANDGLGIATVLATGNRNSFNSQNLTGGQTYYFAVYAYDSNFNYANGQTVTAQVPMQAVNEAPVVTLRHEQANNDRDTVYQDLGNVLVQAMVSDANAGDQHQLDWSETDASLVDTDNDELTFTFDPSNLSPGTYTLRVDATDNGEPALSTTKTLAIKVEEPLPPNVAPVVTVSTQQSGRTRKTAYQNQGNMIMYAGVADDNTDDSHSYVWNIQGNAFTDLDARDEYFTFQAADAALGSYIVSVTVTDDGVPSKETTEEFTITVKERKAGASFNILWLLSLAGLVLLRRKLLD